MVSTIDLVIDDVRTRGPDAEDIAVIADKLCFYDQTTDQLIFTMQELPGRSLSSDAAEMLEMSGFNELDASSPENNYISICGVHDRTRIFAQKVVDLKAWSEFIGMVFDLDQRDQLFQKTPSGPHAENAYGNEPPNPIGPYMLECIRKGGKLKMRPILTEARLQPLFIQCPTRIRKEGQKYFCNGLELDPRGTFYRVTGDIWEVN